MDGSKGFESLEVYERASILRRNIFGLVKQFLSEEKFRLSDPRIRSTRKCPANISEGYGRFYYQENIQFCRIANGSLSESIDHLNVVFECKYIDQQVRTDYCNEINTITKMPNGYIRYLSEIKRTV